MLLRFCVPCEDLIAAPKPNRSTLRFVASPASSSPIWFEETFRSVAAPGPAFPRMVTPEGTTTGCGSSMVENCSLLASE